MAQHFEHRQLLVGDRSPARRSSVRRSRVAGTEMKISQELSRSSLRSAVTGRRSVSERSLRPWRPPRRRTVSPLAQVTSTRRARPTVVVGVGRPGPCCAHAKSFSLDVPRPSSSQPCRDVDSYRPGALPEGSVLRLPVVRTAQLWNRAGQRSTRFAGHRLARRITGYSAGRSLPS